MCHFEFRRHFRSFNVIKVILQDFQSFWCFFYRTAKDFEENNVLMGKCTHRSSMTKGIKIVATNSRSNDSGWLPTKTHYENMLYHCLSDLGSVSIHWKREAAFKFNSMIHGESYSFVITPKIVQSDESVRKIAPQL